MEKIRERPGYFMHFCINHMGNNCTKYLLSAVSVTQNWTKVRCYTAIWRRFIHSCKAKIESRNCRIGVLTTGKLLQAEKSLIKIAQRSVDPENKALLSIQPFCDEDGVLRKKGRLKLADNFPFDVLHPVILPKHHAITKRILEKVHRSLGRPGHKRLKAEECQKYWISGLHDLVWSIYFKCIPRKRQQQPLCEQMMGQLPAFGTDASRPTTPFLNTAVDFFGPLKEKAA